MLAMITAVVLSQVADGGAVSDEELIEQLRAAVRSGAAVDPFIAAHPAVLRATARPYGPTLMWLLEFSEGAAALGLLRAGAAAPEGALALAARGGLDDVVTELLKRGAPVNAGDVTPLHAAAEYGHASTLTLLLAHGAKVDARQANDGFTPLHLAVIDRRVEAVRVLLQAKAPLEAKDDRGRTPLAWGPFAYRPMEKHLYEKLGGPHGTVFVDPGPATAITLLLDAGAKLDAVDEEGNTPLHEAAMLRSIRGAEALRARGARADVKNKAGETPLSLARARGDTAMIELLTKKR